MAVRVQDNSDEIFIIGFAKPRSRFGLWVGGSVKERKKMSEYTRANLHQRAT